MSKNKFKKGDHVIYKPNGQPATITMVYVPGEKATDSFGSSHSLPEGSELKYDIFFMDKSFLWTPAKESELKRYKGD
jgi:hypothetical protein